MKMRPVPALLLLLLSAAVAAQDAPASPPAATQSAPARPQVDADATPWSSGTYTYDGSGNITAIGADTFRYDAHGRLTKAVVSGVTETYTYDRTAISPR